MTTQSSSASEDEQGRAASTLWSSLAHVEPAVEAAEASSTSSHATGTTEPPPPTPLTTHTTQSHGPPASSIASSSLSSPSVREEGLSASLSVLPAASTEGSTMLQVSAPLTSPLTFHARAALTCWRPHHALSSVLSERVGPHAVCDGVHRGAVRPGGDRPRDSRFDARARCGEGTQRQSVQPWRPLAGHRSRAE